MLEDTRKRGATIAIYVIFGILIAVFVINFGPGGGGKSQKGGCSLSSSVEKRLTLDGNNYGMTTWQWALNTRDGSENGQAGIQRKIAAMDLLVRRELLAMEAERRGLVISDAIIDEKLKQGELYVLTQKMDGKRAFFEDGVYFNYKYLERWIGQFGLSIGGFKAEQRRELLAQAMLEELRAGAHVSRDETFALWLHANTTVEFDAVTFPVEAYQAKIVLNDANIDAYLGAHEADVKKKYEDDKALSYTQTPKKVKLRRVFVARTPAPADETPPPAAGADAGTPPAPAAKPDPAKDKLVKARAEIVGKKKTFAETAKAIDADEAMRNKSGDLGWVSVDAPGLGSKEIGDAVKTLKKGEPSEVLESPEGFWLLLVEDERSGDLTYDQVKREIASKLAAEHYAREAARRDALEALADARAGKGKNLTDMFEHKKAEPQDNGQPSVSPEQIEEMLKMYEEELNDPNKSEEEKEQLRQILELIKSGKLGGGPQTGMVQHFYGPAIPASWGQDAADAPPGDAGATPPKPDDVNAPPTSEVLPTFVDVPKAEVQRIGPMPRDPDTIPDLGVSKDLMATLFDELDDGAIAPKIYSVKLLQNGITGGEAFVVVQVITRSKPDLSTFDAQESSLREDMESERGNAIVGSWLQDRCKTLNDAGKIKPSQDALLTTEDGQQKLIPYTPCGNLDI